MSEDEVMMPHAFERLWGAFEPQGEFQTHITESVPQTTVVRHLNDRGFQVCMCCMYHLYPSLRDGCCCGNDFFLGLFGWRFGVKQELAPFYSGAYNVNV